MKKWKKTLSVLLALGITFSSFSGVAYAETSSKPENGVTEEQPFMAGTGGSQKFRIPCLVSLDDGTLVGACDARWNGGADAGGIDTIVSYSKDKGETWNYTFANYLGDNGNVYNNMSTAFIDPALTTDGKNVYMIADLYPAGIAINSAKYLAQTGHTGYNSAHQLVLAKGTDEVNASSSADARKAADFSYYLEKNPDKNGDSYYLLKSSNGTAVSGYTIDAFFNIKGNNVDTNLFCGDSPYFPYPTDFLYMTKSADGGKTWSEPNLIDVKAADEQCFLVGPGRGTVIKSGEHAGRIVFTGYAYTGGDKNSAAIYSDDGGATWTRSESVKNLSSEAVVVEADGKLYMFVRRQNVYYVSNDGGQTWSDSKSMGFSYNAGCQLTAITYSEKIDGKTAIIFAGPSNTSSRAAGKIYVGLVQDDGTLNWKYEYSINGSAFYAYSCITECGDGDLGLLYESEGTSITYKNIPIKDVVPNAAIGSIWMTKADGTIVSSVDMKSNQTQELNINGLDANEISKVTVASDQPDVLEASLKNNKVSLVTKKAEGLKQVKVTVSLGSETAILNVNVTDSDNYKIVDLRRGETKTFKDVTGSYADTSMSGVNKDVAEITLTGEEPDAARAKLATGLGAFKGKNVALEQCMYTFTKAEGDNKYVITANTADGQQVYLSYRSAQNSGFPSSTTSTTITLAKHASDDTFSFFDNTGSRGGYLYFWNLDPMKLYFDRNSTADTACYFELYAPSNDENASSVIDGYKKVTSLDEIQNGGSYLIVTQSDKVGEKYIVYPSLGTNKYEHVARLEITTPLAVKLATSNGNFNGDLEKITDSLYTFVKQSGDNAYQITSVAADGTRVYLDPSSATKPNITSAETVTVSGENGAFKFRDSSHNLHFYYDNLSMLHFDRCGDSCEKGDTFEIYKVSANGTEIKGFEKVTELSELQNGTQYLIVRKATNNKYYVLHPATPTAEICSHVAEVTGDNYQEVLPEGTTEIQIEGKQEGSTSVKIGDVTYYIHVKNNVKNITLEVGEYIVLPGEILEKDNAQNIVTVEKNTKLPPYEKVDTIVSGEKYLIASSSSYLLINTPSKLNGKDGNPNGLDMAPSDFRKGSHEEYMWTITSVDGGYTIQDENGKYLTFSGSNVSVADAAQVLSIGTGASTGYGISYSGQYLNNWAGSNNRVAGYGSNDNNWYLYQPTDGYVLTGKTKGTTSIAFAGTTYNITVELNVQNPFTDVSDGIYYYYPIMWAVKNNIASGYSDGTFRPDADCTRGQVVMFLWNAAGRPVVTVEKNPFSDVNEGGSFYNAIMWAYKNNIASGYSDGTFRPLKNVKRAEYVAFQYRAAKEPAVKTTVNPFTDVTKEKYPNFYNAIMWANENQITFGKTPTTFQPETNTSRSNVVTFLYRANNLIK